jgi:hypothetical protein
MLGRIGWFLDPHMGQPIVAPEDVAFRLVDVSEQATICPGLFGGSTDA